MKEKKYIICNYAKANWGKTKTLLKVIEILKENSNNLDLDQYKFINEKPDTGKDKWCHFSVKGKTVVISTLGDPYSPQLEWLTDAAKTEAKVIVTASRTRGVTLNHVYSVANKYGYEVIWFESFHFDNYVKDLPIFDIRKKEAEKIVEEIDILLNN